MKRNLVMVILVLVVTVFFTACASDNSVSGQDPAPAADSTQQEDVVTPEEPAPIAVPTFESWPSDIKFVRIVTGGVGGSWYPFGAKLAYFLTGDINKVSFSGLAGSSAANIQALHDGDAEVSVSDLLPVIQAYHGDEPFTEQFSELRLIGNFQLTNFGVFVNSDSPIQTFEDMLGKNIVVTNTSSEFITKSLELLGLTESAIKAAGGSLSFNTNDNCVELMQNKQADVYVCQSFVGKPDIMSLDETLGLRWVGLSYEQADLLLGDPYIGQLGTKVTIEAGGLSGQSEAVLTIGMPQVVSTTDKMPDELAYWLVRTMLEESTELGGVSGHFPKAETILDGYQEGVTPPFHDGAIQYFKEIGLM